MTPAESAERGISHGASLPCPSCGREVTCYWPEDEYTGSHQCGACGHVFDAAWPGFSFEPEVVIIDSGKPRGVEAPPRRAAS